MCSSQDRGASAVAPSHLGLAAWRPCLIALMAGVRCASAARGCGRPTVNTGNLSMRLCFTFCWTCMPRQASGQLTMASQHRQFSTRWTRIACLPGHDVLQATFMLGHIHAHAATHARSAGPTTVTGVAALGPRRPRCATSSHCHRTLTALSAAFTRLSMAKSTLLALLQRKARTPSSAHREYSCSWAAVSPTISGVGCLGDGPLWSNWPAGSVSRVY